MKPVLDKLAVHQKVARPDAGHVPKRQAWTFSLRFWRQADLFGLGDVPSSWFISLFDRLSALCKYDLDAFMRDLDAKTTFRFHQIDWSGKKVPVTRATFDWVPNEYLENEEDFPFFQFHVSKALGRVVGFFDEKQIFNVIAFDPNHNIQPSNYNDYKIRPTHVGTCQYSSVATVAHQHAAACHVAGCAMAARIRDAINQEIFDQTGGVIICRLSEEHHSRFVELRGKGMAQDLTEIFEMGMIVYETDAT